ncbi:DUF742 domain-containing protein [Amycolatopsis solani]|uniref:DUF742 domain-containing protein n=1 Tax=Amycolatopsis solani TaxID=3028615 RepID=UPI0025AEE6FC|nr:DUF742 domain-containing protein [Amycolatopsis sp. MEP2-6]
MKNSHDRRPAKLGSATLSFGGWGDYEVWAAHGFTPKPNSDPGHAPEPQAEGGEGAAEPSRDEGEGTSAASRARGERAGGSADAAARATGTGARGKRAGKSAAARTPGRGKASSTGKSAVPATGEASGPSKSDPGARNSGPHRNGAGEPTRKPRPGQPHDPAEDDRTRGRRAASLGTRLEEPGTTAPNTPAAGTAAPSTPAANTVPTTRERPRPYVRGSTPPPPRARHLLPPEVMLFATGRHRGAAGLDQDLAALCRMCQIPTSIAEVSAYLRQSLDATRDLVQHGIDRGLLVADVAELGTAGRPPLALLQRVHQGLLRL